MSESPEKLPNTVPGEQNISICHVREKKVLYKKSRRKVCVWTSIINSVMFTKVCVFPDTLFRALLIELHPVSIACPVIIWPLPSSHFLIYLIVILTNDNLNIPTTLSHIMVMVSSYSLHHLTFNGVRELGSGRKI